MRGRQSPPPAPSAAPSTPSQSLASMEEVAHAERKLLLKNGLRVGFRETVRLAQRVLARALAHPDYRIAIEVAEKVIKLDRLLGAGNLAKKTERSREPRVMKVLPEGKKPEAVDAIALLTKKMINEMP